MGKKKERRKFGDRKDGKLIKKLDPMHVITPILYPNRCDNEAFFMERIDMEPIRAYVQKKNETETLFHYTPFHIITSAFAKVITLRPKMNRFVANKLMYQRNEVVLSFVVKKLFDDDGDEALAIVHTEGSDNIDTLHQKLYEQISAGRSDEIDQSSKSMDIVSKMPRRLTRAFCEFCCFLDKIGKCPGFLIETDPYYTSALLTNIGSMKLNAGYHHLTNWGTLGILITVGAAKQTAYRKEDGTTGYKETIDLGITVDERLADGYYYSKTLRLLKKILAEPELLEKPLDEAVEY